MSKLEVTKKEDGDSNIFSFKGDIDEDANFTEHSLKSLNKAVFDLEEVTAINSCGIREWINWLKTSPDTKLVFRNCPKIIVDQFNMVAGFFPMNGEIESFYVPYYCETSGSEKMILFKNGAEINGSDLKPPADIKCDETGDEMEMDIIESKYFRFLKIS